MNSVAQCSAYEFRCLRDRVESLEYQNASLQTCLEELEIFNAEHFLTLVHKMRFDAIRTRHQSNFEATFSQVVSQQSITNAIAECLRDAAVCAVRSPCSLESQSTKNADAKVFSTKETKEPKPIILAPGEGDSAIYVLGGNDDNKTLNSCERFNPLAHAWEDLPPMKQARSAPAAAILDGLIYVIGGNHCGQTLSHVERFDPAKGVWEAVSPMLRGRSACAAGALNGKLYVCGGWSGKQALNSCERFDPKIGAWEHVVSMAYRREWPVMTVDDDQLYLCGGQDGSEDVNVVECFDPHKMVWETLEMKLKCRRNAAVAVVSSQLYLCGGHGHDGKNVLNLVEKFVPARGEWEETIPMQTHRRNAMSVAVSGRIYVCGGRGSRGNQNQGGGHALRTAERFDTISGVWETIPPMSQRRYRSAAVVIQKPKNS